MPGNDLFQHKISVKRYGTSGKEGVSCYQNGRFVMENELCVNGFSAVSENEMMEV